MAWSTTVPASSEAVSGSTTAIRANWDAIATTFSTEHGAMTSASSGQHSAGIGLGFLKYGTTAEISAATSPGTGALAYDSSKGILECYHTSGGWGSITRDYFSRVYTVAPSAQSILKLTHTKISTFGTPTYDGLSEFSSNRITIKDSGYYLIVGYCKFLSYAEDFSKQLEIYVNGAVRSVYSTKGRDNLNLEVSDILSLTTGDYIELYVFHDSTVSQTISDGPFAAASLTLTRLS